MRISKRIGALLAAATMLMAGGALASEIEHVDTFDDFGDTWASSPQLTVEQRDGAVVLSSGSGRGWYGAGALPHFETDITKIAFDYTLEEGSFDVRIWRYADDWSPIGASVLPMDPNGRRWLPREIDMTDARSFRVFLSLAPDTTVEISEMKAISGAPEPSAALLLSMGMTVTGMRMRAKRARG
jgi:hypothetical protein